jgi:hypothetical protein
VAGFLLIVMGPASEEAAFWTLAALLEEKCFAYCGGQVCQRSGRHRPRVAV